jgi:hypothetical protein
LALAIVDFELNGASLPANWAINRVGHFMVLIEISSRC